MALFMDIFLAAHIVTVDTLVLATNTATETKQKTAQYIFMIGYCGAVSKVKCHITIECHVKYTYTFHCLYRRHKMKFVIEMKEKCGHVYSVHIEKN